MDGFDIVFNHYAYMDVPEYYADQYFEQNRIHVLFDSEYTHPDHRYRVIMCRVPKWEGRKFEKSMRSLKNLMALSGKRDYDDVCQALFRRKNKT